MADLRFFVTQEGTLGQGGSGNDTVFNYTGLFSSNTVKGAGGNDIISFANQTTAVTLTAFLSAGHGSAGEAREGSDLTLTYNGAYDSAGTLGTTFSTSTGDISAGQAVTLSATIQSLQATGVTAVRKGVIAAGQGNDGIYLGDQISEFDNVSVRGGKGNDAIGTYNSGGTRTGELTDLSGGELKGGDGNDTVFVNLSATSGTDFRLVGNKGDDSVQFSGVDVEANSGFFGGGAGNDSVVVAAATAISTTVGGGNGNDSLNVNFSAVTTKALINGDGGSTGVDTIRLAFDTYSSTSVYGGAAADSIVLSASTDAGSNIFDAGAGNDTILFQSAGASTLSGSTVKGGAGNDSILFEAIANASVNSGYFQGGAGNDTITLSDKNDIGSAGAVNTTIKGGAGADSISLSAVETGGSGTFAYSKFNESTLSSMDTLTFQTAAISADANGAYASALLHVQVNMGLNTGVTGAGNVGAVSASGGYVVWSGYSDNSLTARVSAVDAAFTTTGDFAVFTTNNTTRYLFVQGGTNDLVARLSDADALSAGQANLFRSGNSIGFES